MIKNRGLRPFAALSLALVIVALFGFGIFIGMNAPAMLTGYDDSKMVVYANVITASDGHRYYVTVTDSYAAGKQSWRVADAYSLDSQYAGITGVGRTETPSWTKLSSCSRENVKAGDDCKHTSEAEALLNEMVQKVMARENIIGNMEIFWAWEVGRKNLIDQIKK